MKNKKKVLLGLAALSVVGVAGATAGTFAWYTATNFTKSSMTQVVVNVQDNTPTNVTGSISYQYIYKTGEKSIALKEEKSFGSSSGLLTKDYLLACPGSSDTSNDVLVNYVNINSSDVLSSDSAIVGVMIIASVTGIDSLDTTTYNFNVKATFAIGSGSGTAAIKCKSAESTSAAYTFSLDGVTFGDASTLTSGTESAVQSASYKSEGANAYWRAIVWVDGSAVTKYDNTQSLTIDANVDKAA